MNGWIGKVLRVNLTRGDYKIESLHPALARDFIGGRGLASKILCDEVDPAVDPLGPENKLIFAAGPLTGTGAISGCTCAVVTKSPLTGAIACSMSGGHFGSELKFAGYDAIVLEGKSAEPVYLSVADSNVEIVSAQQLWGLTTGETEDLMKSRMNDQWKARETHIASIGPAGEKLVKFASIVSDKYWAAARSGVGAVMGSKNLKAIAISGTGGIPLADGPGFMQIIPGIIDEIKAAPLTSQALPDLGTAFLVDIMNQSGVLATRNFQSGSFAGAEKISGQAMASNIAVSNRGCFSCPIACRRMSRVAGPRFQGSGQGPEYEALAALGPCCGIGDLAAIARASYLCTELGLDPISAGVVIACAMELHENGILTKREVGVRLDFGHAGAVIEMLQLIAQRQGFGDLLAEGAYRLAERYGHGEFFIGVKGQEAPPYDPRGIQGLGLHYATSNSGACHDNGYTVLDEILGVRQEIDPLATDGKAPLVKLVQDVTAVLDSCGLCFLVLMGGVWVMHIFAMVECVTGAGYSEDSLLLAGERVYNLERLFNLRAGFGAEDDTLPARMLDQPMPDGPAQGQVCQLGQMLPRYYELRGWDAKGVPTPEKLAELGLDREAGSD